MTRPNSQPPPPAKIIPADSSAWNGNVQFMLGCFSFYIPAHPQSFFSVLIWGVCHD
uniref:Uncharacterized protein n=1 Tax=Anguilla anguilla TaxID=7936 RepID=A0A0E9SEN8_ANGAN